MSRAKRLGGLLRVRQLQERAARAELMRATAEAERAEQVAELKRRHYEDDEELVSVDAETWRSLRATREAQAASVRALYGVARSARQIESAGREAWTGANQRAHGMEKLVDKVAAREAAERELAQQRVTDDLSGARFVARQQQDDLTDSDFSGGDA